MRLSPEDSDIVDLITRALSEDIGDGDITSNAVLIPTDRLSAEMNAREDMVVAGLPLAAAIFHHLDPGCAISQPVDDGQQVTKGTTLMRVSGSAIPLLTTERTALNFIQHLSGIATLTRRYVDAIEGTHARLLDTRKTTPGLRRLEKYAVHMGGGQNHRMGLFDAVMIKDNHIAAAGSIKGAVTRARSAGHTKIQVECDTLAQVEEAIKVGATSLLLDNMDKNTLQKAVAMAAGKVTTEASGGVTLDTIRVIAETGVDFISVGRLTQSAPAVDIGLDFNQ